MSRFAFCYLSVIKEAAVLKKHNLFEDNIALPSESVSSLTDLKITTGSNQASPARRASTFLPGAQDSETPSNEVFQESEEKEEPGVPSSMARGESLPFPGPSPLAGGGGQVIVCSEDDAAVSLVAAEDTARPVSAHSSEPEFGGTAANEKPIHEKPESTTASGSLKELRELLTVTIEVPVESAPDPEKDINEGILIPQENEKEEEKTQIYTEASQAAAPQQDNFEDSNIGEEAHPCPPEAEAPVVDLGAFPEASIPAPPPAYTGHMEDTGCPGPTERELAARASMLDAHEGGEATCAVEGDIMPQEGGILSSDPICPGESQVSEEPEAAEGKGLATSSVDTQKVKATGVHECQWVVENVADTCVPAAHEDGGKETQECQESAPEQPSED
jgi:hypothetical protein